jgi:hypothetical protein
MELTFTFNAEIISGQTCIAISKDEWNIEELGDIYIIIKKDNNKIYETK